MTNISRDDLPKAQSRSVAALHDERFHFVQRLLGVRMLLETKASLSIIYDDASKRGRSMLGAQVRHSPPKRRRSGAAPVAPCANR